MNERSFVVTDGDAGQRLDGVTRRHFAPLSRQQLACAFSEGRVTVDGRPARKSLLLRTGQRVELTELDASPLDPATLRVVLETDRIVVIDKPAGVPSTPRFPGARSSRGPASIAELLLARHPNMDSVGYRPSDAGLLGRLDVETSGLLIAAKSRAAFSALSTGAGLVKGYLAVVGPDCSLGPARIETLLGPARGSKRRVAVLPGSGHARGHGGEATRGAASRLRTTDIVNVRPGPVASLVELRVQRAYRHQIRVHLAHLGWPLLGDTLYGGPPLPNSRRHALHAHLLAWAGSTELPSFDLELPLPADLADLLEGRRD